MLYRLGITGAALFISIGCSSRSDAGDTSVAVPSEADEAAPAAAPAASTAATPESSLIGVDQMPETAKFSVSGPKPYDQWNGSWTVSSNGFGCGINTYPKMINFDIADEDQSRPDFQELRIGSNDGPDVGGSTSKFGLVLSLDRKVPNLSINPGNTPSDTGTLTVLSNSNGTSKFSVTAKSSNGIEFSGEFTCVPRPSQ